MTIKSIAIVEPGNVTVVAAPYAPAGPVLAGTSSTENDIGIGGTYVFVMDQVGLGFMAGVRVRASAAADPDNWIEGVVTAFDGTNLTIVSDLTHGFGVHDDWNVTVAGEPGKKGDKGDPGPQGPPGPSGGEVPIDSPFFTGDPRAPTPLPGDNDNSLATTQFVTSALVNKQAFDPDLTSLAAASAVGAIYYRSAADTWGPITVGTGLSFAGGTLSLSAASFDSPTFTGDPKSVTFPKTDNDTTIATTAFVHSVVADYAPIADPIFQGDARAPTPPSSDNDETLATTRFVKNVAQPLDADLTSLANASGTNVWYYRSAADTWSPVVIGANLLFAGGTLSATGGGSGGDGAPTDSPVFTGDPQVPTAPGGDTDSTIANTQWVQLELAGYAKLASPSFSGDPRAPTPATADNDTSIATTAFVKNVLGTYQPIDADLTSLAAASATNAIYYRSAADTWGPVTLGTGLTLSGGTLNGGDVFKAATQTLTGLNTFTATTILAKYSADAVGQLIVFQKSRAATIGNHVAVAANDVLGQIDFTGSDGVSAFGLGGAIKCVAEGAPISGKVPVKIGVAVTRKGDAFQQDSWWFRDSGGLSAVTLGDPGYGQINCLGIQTQQGGGDAQGQSLTIKNQALTGYGYFWMASANDVMIGNLHATAGIVLYSNNDSVNGILASFRPAKGLLVKGVTDGSACPAGYVGEVIESIRDSSLRFGMGANSHQTITSITLPPGDWEIKAGATYYAESGTIGTPSTFHAMISTVNNGISSSNLPGHPSWSSLLSTTLGQFTPATLFQRAILSTTTNYYIVGWHNAGSVNVYGQGWISARRMR